MKVALIDTIPIDARNQGSVNLGYEIVASKLDADRYHFTDVVEEVYDTIAFNVFYITHIFNLLSFLHRNEIEPIKHKREEKPYLLAGGQGVSNLSGLLDSIVDEIYCGEIDSDWVDKQGWHRAKKIHSPPAVKNGKGMIELTRGCKYRCTFCEYGHVAGGRYREKPIEQVKTEISTLMLTENVKRINFLSANIGAYSKIDELVDYAGSVGISIMNSDLCLRDFKRASEHFVENKVVKVGLESFTESVRTAVKKPISDDELREFLNWSMDNLSYIHLYLIYGLPDENYDAWVKWLEIISEMRKSKSHPIRVEFNITNFEPVKGTPLEDAPQVDFIEKSKFIKEWTTAQQKFGFRKGNNEVTYANAMGRLGRRRESYELLMALREEDDSITEHLLNSFKSGVRRSISPEQAQKFVDKIRKK